jgi:hypothetical protein
MHWHTNIIMWWVGNSKIQIPGTQVIPVPFFHALDGKDSRDYVARVEPSSQGGRKMAEFLLDIITDKGSYSSYNRAGGVGNVGVATTATPLQASYMEDRS